jgi:hypothetical protein
MLSMVRLVLCGSYGAREMPAGNERPQEAMPERHLPCQLHIHKLVLSQICIELDLKDRLVVDVSQLGHHSRIDEHIGVCPGLRDATGVPVDDDRGGPQVAAEVVLRGGSDCVSDTTHIR